MAMSRCLDAVGEVLAISNVASSGRGQRWLSGQRIPANASSGFGKNKGHNSQTPG
jgi:hypothetical protein